jgi:hypothetical protein
VKQKRSRFGGNRATLFFSDLGSSVRSVIKGGTAPTLCAIPHILYFRQRKARRIVRRGAVRARIVPA